MPFWGDMLVPWRVYTSSKGSFSNSHVSLPEGNAREKDILRHPKTCQEKTSSRCHDVLGAQFGRFFADDLLCVFSFAKKKQERGEKTGKCLVEVSSVQSQIFEKSPS